MSKLRNLKKYVMEGSAEKERDIRNKVFFETDSVKKLLNRFDENFIVLKSPKGTGKSFILEELASRAIENNALSIFITPKDLDLDIISSKTSIGSKEQAAEEQIIKIIANKLGSIYQNQEIPLLDSERNLYLNALQSNVVRKDILARGLSCILDLLPRNEQIKKALKELSPINSSSEILREDISDVLKSKSRKVLLFIDDIDLAGIKTDLSINYESSWALLSAAFNISCDITNISIIVSVRTDVWHTMLRKRLGSDKRDKITNIFSINNNETDMLNIFYGRLYASINPSNISRPEILSLFFENDMILPGVHNESRKWDTWICKQSRERPRDLVQLVKLMIDEALDKNVSKINSNHAKAILEKFGESRISNIADEFYTICPQIEALCKRFKKTQYNYNEIIEELKRIPASLSITIDGNTMHQNNIDDALEMLRVLHMANFINPRIEDPCQPKGYDHLLFINNEDLISKSNQEKLSTYKFEIHPVFHSVIAAQKKV